MDSFFKGLGRKAGETYNKSRWLYDSLLGSEEERIASEYKLGHQMANEVTAQSELVEIEFTGVLHKRLAKWINSPHRFNSTVLRSDEVNAFVLPGGYIFLTEAIVNFCKRNEDELAFIIAHEMAHVVKGHAFDRMIADHSIQVISKWLRVGGLAGAAAKQATLKFLKTQYSRDNEHEADDFGIRLAMAAGYDPKGAVRLFERLKTLGESDIPEYFSTHPSFNSRLVQIEKAAHRARTR
ncbi:M48 family metallopeptidase [Opitutia bacterium ISCC 51]|nr:M48 family metallopeptidase [Opitutae bacterium ISCC 51]QXD29260.1 M48 family metallopeptidase [Opitutae bacterium ISCC 52]